MNRLQRKCLVASAVTHGLLVLMLLVGSAFVPPSVPIDDAVAIQLIEIPDFLVDEPNMVGGGNPKAGIPDPAPMPETRATPPIPAVQPIPQPLPAPPEKEAIPDPPRQPQPEPAPVPQVAKPAEEKTIEAPKPEPKKFDFSEVVSKKPEVPQKTEKQPSFDLSKAERKTIKPSAAAPPNGARPNEGAESKAAAAREAQLASAAGAALARMQKGLSTGVGEIGIPGPGGAAYASYGLVLRKIYYDAWIAPAAAADNEPVVQVEIVIARDGTVLSSRILKRSGKRELDRSVQETLNRVKKVRAFPSGSTDEKRTFRIHFDLSSRQSVG